MDEVYLSPGVVETLRKIAVAAEAIEAERSERQRIRAQAQYERVKTGPYLEPDGAGGQWVLIPSDWDNKEAARFWAAVGCRFLATEKAWVRPVDLPYRHKRYTARQWLRSLRRKFFEFYGEELAERAARHDDGSQGEAVNGL